tara:strand:- start:104 stop:517 length:414 start_codon:yes stop_codon:yes gene_type:complete
MQGGGLSLDKMHAGGLCGLATELDPSITTSDNLSGQVVSLSGSLPETRERIDISVHLMDSMVSTDGSNPEKIHPLRNNEMLMINVATATSVGVTKNAEKTRTGLELRLPICVDVGERVSLSRRIGSRWRLIGYGIIQ